MNGVLLGLGTVAVLAAASASRGSAAWKPAYALATVAEGGVWTLPENPIWNVPEDLGEVRFKYETVGPWQILVRLHGLAVGRNGQVYGMRSLQKREEVGYTLHGTVSVGGRTLRAYTTSQMFQRPDRSLVEVAVLRVVDPWDKVPRITGVKVGSGARLVPSESPNLRDKVWTIGSYTVSITDNDPGHVNFALLYWNDTKGQARDQLARLAIWSVEGSKHAHWRAIKALPELARAMPRRDRAEGTRVFKAWVERLEKVPRIWDPRGSHAREPRTPFPFRRGDLVEWRNVRGEADRGRYLRLAPVSDYSRAYGREAQVTWDETWPPEQDEDGDVFREVTFGALRVIRIPRITDILPPSKRGPRGR